MSDVGTAGVWVGEMVPAHTVFPGEMDDGMVAYEITRHRARRAANTGVAHYLRYLAKRPEVVKRGEAAMYLAAADMFVSSGMARLHTGLVLRIGNRVFRVRWDKD